MKTRTRNFQSIADVVLDIKGLTVVTGKSNQGKTALIRSISATLFGQAGDHFVKRGEDFTWGTVEFEGKDPLKVEWRKVPTSKRKPNLQSSLEINGTEHSKLGREHRNLTAPHGICELETTATRLRPQVAGQHDPIFLIAENETTCAEVLKLLGRVDTITAAQGFARADLREAEQRRKLRTEDKLQAERELAELAYIPALNRELAALRRELELKDKAEAERERLRGALRELETARPTTLPAPPKLEDPTRTAELRALLTELTGLRATTLPAPPPAPPTPDQETRTRLRELQELEAELAEGARRKSALETALERTRADTEVLKVSLKTCPTCGRLFEGPTFHTEHTDYESI